MADGPRLLLLLPRLLEAFILRDQAEDLLRSPDVVAAPPPRPGYGAFARAPTAAHGTLAAAMAAQLRRAVGGPFAAVAIFHPLQLPVARRLVGEGELWYGVWDRFDAAGDASPALRARLAALHDEALRRSALTFAASGALARLAGERAVAVGLAADRFPSAPVAPGVVAVSLGHLGRRVDWAMLRHALEDVDDLTLLLVGELHRDEMQSDADFAAVDAHPRALLLGRQDDREAAGLFALADVGILPFARDPFNDAGLPYRILKAARLGRATVVPPLAGTRTWARATVEVDGREAVAAALRDHAGRRVAPDEALRAWALEQTAERVNGPLWERARALGVAGPSA